MYDPYIGFYPARETSVKNRSGLERHSIFTQAPLPPMPMIPLSPGGLTPGQALTDFLGLPGTTPVPAETPAAPLTCPIGYKKAWEVSPSVLAIYPDADTAQTPLTGLAPVVVPKAPYFAVPANPLLPPEYREVISYEGLQYLNGFLRAQIGRFCYIEFLFGTSGLDTRYGVLVGVGINYILLEHPITRELTVADFFSIRYVEFVDIEKFQLSE